MKILHFIMGKANPDRANGVNSVIHGICKYTSLAGHDIRVIGLSKSMNNRHEIIQRDNFKVYVYKNFFRECFDELKRQAQEVDIVHLHSVWQHYNIIFANYLRSINKPYIITVHSGLTEDRLKQSKYLIKILYHKFFQKKIFDNANGLHAITREEMTHLLHYTSNKNIFFVPNGIDIENYLLKSKEYKTESEEIKFGYLGRFGKEKNIYGLLMAISQLPLEILKKIKCYLIGPIDFEAKRLQNIVKNLSLESNINFTGPLYGKDKTDILNRLDFYVHPAFSDVVSISVMEAMASGLPCVITRTSQVSYYYNSNAFIMVEPTPSDIARGLVEMINLRNYWETMSKNSINLVKNIFNWQSVVQLLLSEYNNILDCTSKVPNQ